MLRFAFLPALAVYAGGLLLPVQAPAQSAAPLKVSIINMQRAVLATDEITKASKDMATKFKPRQDQLEQLQKEMATIQAQLQGSQVTPAQQADLTAEGQRKQREAQRISEDLQADVERERTEILQRASQRMGEVVKKLAEDKGLDMVVDTTTAVFFKPALEVTEEAVAAYNKTYPAK
jgi:outer membrane protein